MQSVMVCMNVLVLLFVAAVGLWAGFAHGWKGYEQSEGYSTISLSLFPGQPTRVQIVELSFIQWGFRRELVPYIFPFLALHTKSNEFSPLEVHASR